MVLARRSFLGGFITTLAFSSGVLPLSAADSVARTIQLAPSGDQRDAPVITAMSIDPQGEFLAVGGDDHSIRVLRQDDLTEVASLNGHSDWVRSLAFRPDGKLLASTSNDGRLLLWKRGEPWNQLQAIEGGPALFRVRFAPLGGVIGAVGFDPQLFLIGPGTSERPPLKCGCNDMRALAFSDDNRFVGAAGRTGELHLFNSANGELEGGYALHRGRVRDMVFLEGTDTLVSVGEDGTAIVFDGLRRQVVQKIRVPGCKLLAVVQLDSRCVAVGGADNKIRLMDIDRGVVIDELTGHTGSVSELAANRKFLFSGSFDATVRRWEIDTILAAPKVAGSTEAEGPDLRTSRRPDGSPK